MKLVLLLLAFLLTSGYASDHCKESASPVQNDCDTTDYESYVICIRRTKRSSRCSNSCSSGSCETEIDEPQCGSCDCNNCETSECDDNRSCRSCCSSCCAQIQSCTTNHCCHKTCHTTCRTSSCRSSCRRSCYKSVNSDKSNSAVKVDSKSLHNITTIIHLNNLINNTNLIDVPITLNNTNVNNITLKGSPPGRQNTVFQYPVLPQPGQIVPQSPLPSQQSNINDPNCCLVISPRQCTPTDKWPFIKCFHYRSKQCGEFCTADIVHVEPQNICDTPEGQAEPSCRQQLIYIPQPQPRCSVQSYWPYVSCTGSSQNPSSCEGCYRHLVDPSSKAYQNCPSNCYDQTNVYQPNPYQQNPYSQNPYQPNPYQPNPYQQNPYYQGGYGYGFEQGYRGGVPWAQPLVSPYTNLAYNQANLELYGLDSNKPINSLITGQNGTNEVIDEPLNPQVSYNNPALIHNQYQREVLIEAETLPQQEPQIYDTL